MGLIRYRRDAEIDAKKVKTLTAFKQFTAVSRDSATGYIIPFVATHDPADIVGVIQEDVPVTNTLNIDVMVETCIEPNSYFEVGVQGGPLVAATHLNKEFDFAVTGSGDTVVNLAATAKKHCRIERILPNGNAVVSIRRANAL